MSSFNKCNEDITGTGAPTPLILRFAMREVSSGAYTPVGRSGEGFSLSNRALKISGGNNSDAIAWSSSKARF